jgi:hypothetical protein
LGLDEEPPVLGAHKFEKIPDHPLGFYRMVRIPFSVQEQERQKWLKEGKQGYWVTEARRLLHIAGHNLTSQREWKDFPVLSHAASSWRFNQELFHARRLTWTAEHYARRGETTAIDGSLTLPSGRNKFFEIACMGEKLLGCEEDWRFGFDDSEQYKDNTFEITLPTQVLTPALIPVALQHWYMTRFQYRPDSWAMRERRLPIFIIDEAWEEDAKQALAEQSEAGDQAEKTLQALLQNKEISRLYGYFGTSRERVLPAW